MSEFRAVQDWLSEHQLCPAAGLAEVWPSSDPCRTPISFAWLSPDGSRALIRKVVVGQRFDDCFVDLFGDSDCHELPTDAWGEPQYLRSPSGCWFAAVISEGLPVDWDETPEGVPTLNRYVSGYDGRTGTLLWKEQVESVHASYEWTPDEKLRAAGCVWNPADSARL